MSSAIDIQIVSTPNLAKIENFLNDSTYRETIEYSANFNTRLCIERRLRLPFLDPQTGVAQNHCSLFMDRRQRMPGFREGQIYSYPAARWRKSRRQYLTKILRPFGAVAVAVAAATSSNSSVNSSAGGGGSTGNTGVNAGIGAAALSASSLAASKRGSDVVQIPVTVTGELSSMQYSDNDFNGSGFLEESSSLGGADTSDSKDSQNIKDDLPKEWFYDDMDINEIDGLEEPKSPADDEYDYDPRYGNKKRKKRKPGRKASLPQAHHHVGHEGGGPRKGRPPGGGGGGGVGRGRGRRKNQNSSRTVLDPPSPGPISEPPSFETAAAAVEHASNDDSSSSDLRSYRKYL